MTEAGAVLLAILGIGLFIGAAIEWVEERKRSRR